MPTEPPNPTAEKRQAFSAAADLLANFRVNSSHHVALELRRCIEAIVYEKLWAYRQFIPAEVARTWQPPQAFKALLAFDPEVQETSTVFVGEHADIAAPPEGSLKPLGTDYRPKGAWLSKNWNKLGALVHAAWPFDKRGHSDHLAYFRSLLAELEPFVKSSITFAMAPTVQFKCSNCGADVIVMEAVVQTTSQAICLYCNAAFDAVMNQGQYTFFPLTAPMDCPQCSAPIFPPQRELHVGYVFTCTKCNCSYEVIGRSWEVRKTADTNESAAADE